MKLATLFLKILLVGLAGFILFFSFLITFGWLTQLSEGGLPFVQGLAVGCIYVIALLALGILWSIFRLLRFIDFQQAFSDKSLAVIRQIRWQILGIFLVTLGLLPMFYQVADLEDAPGVMLIGLAISLIFLAITVFAATLEKLFASAIIFKSENDLTI